MPEPEFIRSLFDLPEEIHKGDFVLKLTEGLRDPAGTVRTFVVTPALAQAFDRSLGLVGSCLRDEVSKATYLHGSFGSGKSHFMAVLSLLLGGSEAAWGIPELHALREKHGFVGEAKLLQLHFHMLGATSLEAAVFRQYLDFVAERHPDAPIPGLFADEELFADARRLLEQIGDEAFFADMGGGRKDWGKRASGWDRARFDAAASSSDPRQRQQLFSALVKTWFKSYAAQEQAYIDIDTGLAVMAAHAAELGYGAVVLFLDELILWLSSRATDSNWMHNEVQKMVKLVESQSSDRAIPIVSFIARQRSLVQMVGRDHAGAEIKRLYDTLEHWEGRYDTITLEDRNLPAIIERRVLRPRSEAAKRTLDSAFDAMKRSAGPSWQTLLGTQDEAAFRKIYPFSPALVEALVALSNSLQRERTAIKLLYELLVEHLRDLTVGETVRVGDLFDVLAGGEDPADGVMRSRFNAAKQLYKYQLLPLVRESNGTNTPARCQRMRDDHQLRLGCSGCPEKPCRTDNRLVKTLLIAALVPEVAVLKDMTATRLYQLNHGTLKVLIPQGEAQVVTQKLRQWAAAVAQMRLGQEQNPAVSISLEGVDLKPILERYSNEDTTGARQRVLRELLFAELGVARLGQSTVEFKHDWRFTKRCGEIVFGNVRAMSDEVLRCPDPHDFRIVIDYPFDDPGMKPHHDVNRIEQFTAQGSGAWTLVWLPSFFSSAMNQLLGEYVILDYLVSSREAMSLAVSHLSVENQARAREDLQNLHGQKKSRLVDVLSQAYGLRAESESDIDPSLRVEFHLHLLKPGAALVAGMAPNLAEAKTTYATAVLEARYPRHPHFNRTLSAKEVEHLVVKFEELLASEHQYLPVDKELRAELLGTLGELGLVRVQETSVHLMTDGLLQKLENRRLQLGVARPTVGEVRGYIDEGQKMGLELEAQDLVVRCYARWSRRTFELGGRLYEPPAGRPMAAEVVLDQPELPEQTDWAQALAKAGQCFGLTLAGRFLNPDNVKRLGTGLHEAVEKHARVCSALPPLLQQRGRELGVGEGFARLETARAADSLCGALRSKSAVEQIRALARFEPRTNGAALGRHMGAAEKTLAVLQAELMFGVFAQLTVAKDGLVGAAELLEKAALVMGQDEVNASLAERLNDLAVTGQKLLQPAPQVEGLAVGVEGSRTTARRLKAHGTGRVRAELEAMLAELAGAEDAELTGTLVITKKP